MKISANEIVFSSLTEITEFCNELGLWGSFQFAEPIQDNSDNILIKEDINIKESAIRKLETMEGGYKPNFKVKVTNPILKIAAEKIADIIKNRLKEPDNAFIALLYENSVPNYRAFISNSIRPRKIVLTLYKLLKEKSVFFGHIADLGLLCLGVIMQKPVKVRFIHRNAFLVGLLADMALVETGEWMMPVEDEKTRAMLADRCATFLPPFEVRPEVIAAVRNHTVKATIPIGGESPIDSVIESRGLGSDGSVFDSILEGGDEPSSSGPAEEDELMTIMLTESMRIARYISDTNKKITERDHLAEALVYFLAYNTAKGLFHKEMVEPLLRKFRAFEEEARRLMKIGLVEKKCLYLPSAWAYPKPRATQILCQNRVYDCPNLVSGWDIHVISPQEAFGWIGAPLGAGNYPKCSLEKELENWMPAPQNKKPVRSVGPVDNQDAPKDPENNQKDSGDKNKN